MRLCAAQARARQTTKDKVKKLENSPSNKQKNAHFPEVTIQVGMSESGFLIHRNGRQGQT